ncbi:MAG: ribonuclease HII [Rickettsiales bacterium]|nr:ribonuclease HII [Rickettsiales bacterium]
MIVAGTDEAGRGPLCGPVVAAAVIIAKDARVGISNGVVKITDSKRMTKIQRETAYDWIVGNTIWAIGMCDPVEIDEINILHASLLAMKRAIGNLSQKPDFVLVDGNKLPVGIAGRAVVKGDGKSFSIAAASIIAKVARDRIMAELAEKFPQYGWDKNAGYPTAAHIAAIRQFGINEHYRKTFAPVRDVMGTIESSEFFVIPA